MDLLRDGHANNLLDDSAWSFWRDRIIAGVYAGVFTSPPCGTASRAREHRPGPPLLRSVEHVEGLPNLPADLKQQVREANILADRCFEAMELAASLGICCATEQPLEQLNRPSLFQLPRARALTCRKHFYRADGDQCPFGAISAKPTTFLYANVDFAPFAQSRCNHRPAWHAWRDTCGACRYTWAPHAPLFGRKVNGQWATALAADYPPDLCRWIAAAFAAAAKQPSSALVVAPSTRYEDASTLRQAALLRGVTLQRSLVSARERNVRAELAREDVSHIGGMRNPHAARQFLPRLPYVGVSLRQHISAAVEAHPELLHVTTALRRGEPTVGFPAAIIADLRDRIVNTLQPTGRISGATTSDVVRSFGDASGYEDASTHS